MILGSTQPLTEMSTKNLLRGKGRPASKADNLTAICEPTVQKNWEPRRLTNLWASTACYRDSFTFHYMNYVVQALFGYVQPFKLNDNIEKATQNRSF
jgi:hypothetical protein